MFLALLLGEIVAMMKWGLWVLLPIVAISIIIKIIANAQWKFVAMIFLCAIIGFLITSNEVKVRNRVWNYEEGDISVYGNVEKIYSTKNSYALYLDDA